MTEGVRPMAEGDVDWVVDLARQRRESLVPHAPRFWRPAADATARHRAFLADLVADRDVLSVRSQHGFLIALRQGPRWLVDDAVVTPRGDWADDGVRLLRHAQEQGGPLRFVVPVFEADRMAAGRSVGLAPVEHWWHRDLAPPATAAAGADPLVVVDGARGRLVTAPPVYDPGGPVLLVTEAAGIDSLGRIESEASTRGAAVSVVSQEPDDERLAALLTEAGYVLTTAFCEVTA